MNSAVWVYPFDLLDEGVDAALSDIARLGVDGISLAATYHAGRLLLPHNPRRTVYFLEDGVAYFHTDALRYAGLALKPKVADLAAEQDPFAIARESAARHDLQIGAWTVCLHNSRLGRTHTDCTMRNAFGEAYTYALCPSHPDVRAYVLALCEDVAATCRPSVLELEAFGFMSYEHNSHHDKLTFPLDAARVFLLSACFCPHCTARMRDAGFDPDRLSATVRSELKTYFETGGPPRVKTRAEIDDYLGESLGEAPLKGLLAVREDVMGSLIADLRGRLPASLPIYWQCAPSPYTGGAAAGLSLAVARSSVDAIIVNLFLHDEDAMRSELRDARQSAGGGTPLIANVRAHGPDSADEAAFLRKIRILEEEGIQGIRFYHYGLVPSSHLGWIGRAMEVLA